MEELQARSLKCATALPPLILQSGIEIWSEFDTRAISPLLESRVMLLRNDNIFYWPIQLWGALLSKHLPTEM